MADYNVKEIAYGGNNYKMRPANLTSETQLQNAAQDATETPGRIYPVRLDANGKLAVNVPWSSSGESDMTGATETTAGTHGLVPAPAAGDQDKVLKGDGTWGTAIDERVGSLNNLTTTDKSNIVAAINEVNGKIKQKQVQATTDGSGNIQASTVGLSTSNSAVLGVYPVNQSAIRSFLPYVTSTGGWGIHVASDTALETPVKNTSITVMIVYLAF